MIEQLLTTEEVGEILQVPVKTLYRWSYHGTGPPVIRIGRHLRYPSDLLAGWITSGIKERQDDR